MASPSVTYSFTNGTAADATQVNTNFTDIINGVSDGTKDLSVFAITAASTATFNGNVNLGNSSTDDVVFTGSLESDIPIGNNNSYNIGSGTLGLASIYLGAAGGFTTRLKSAATSSHTLTLPPTAGSDGSVFVNGGSASAYWYINNTGIHNAGLAVSVGANALTISLKGADGNDPSSTNRVTAVFRNGTATTGTPSVAVATSATSITISSGSTLGHGSNVTEQINVFLINNSGTLELGVITENIIDSGTIQTSVTEGGGGAADSRTTLYSSTARTAPVRLFARLKSNQATAGTWASSPSEVTIYGQPPSFRPKSYIIYDTASGHGSTNTTTRTWTNLTTFGSDMTATQSATNGDLITVNTAGIYGAQYFDTFGGSANIAITINGAVGSTQAQSQAIGALVALTSTQGTDSFGCASGTFTAVPGDIIRACTQGTATGVTNKTKLAVYLIQPL